MSVNAHRAFDNTGGKSYRKNLDPLDNEIEELRRARDLVRTTLKTAFAGWETRIPVRALFEDVAVASFSARDEKPRLSPKFRGQGSYVYATLNQPTHNPPQEMDFDDGMFLPTSFLSENGGSHPIVASRGYFALVESALEPLCREKGWILNPGRARPSCVRVCLNNGRSHLDIALYAIPDDQYHVLVEKAATASNRSFGVIDEGIMFDSVYETIAADQIMLAHREDGWKVSDPRKLEAWFLNAVKTHGEQLRRLSRYLKGWRDHTWENCRLSSIALMAGAVRFFEEAREYFVGRDDLALQALAANLPTYLSQHIPNPVVDGRLDEGWDDGPNPCRNEFVAKATALKASVSAALAEPTAVAASAALRKIFGAHFPADASLISEDRQVEYKSAGVAASAAVIGISASEQAARAKSAANALVSQGLASKPWASSSGD